VSLVAPSPALAVIHRHLAAILAAEQLDNDHLRLFGAINQHYCS
jgi:hypothetical protein